MSKQTHLIKVGSCESVSMICVCVWWFYLSMCGISPYVFTYASFIFQQFILRFALGVWTARISFSSPHTLFSFQHSHEWRIAGCRNGQQFRAANFSFLLKKKSSWNMAPLPQSPSPYSQVFLLWDVSPS